MSDDEPRLIADAMLGGLARWLRALGLDVAYDPALDDAGLVATAVREGRLILTRDRKLVERRLARCHLLIASDQVPEQLRQVLDALALTLDPARLLSRCLRCNAPLVELAAEEALPRVPPFVARTQRRFRECPQCHRVYWAATHATRMRQRLASLGLLG
ncbi:MAG TPA: Mut7-C RNAse domain-containing protein [Thermoanaerobaculia bacterium]|nr:Mut7-C RNAse domain-containing protein [Thermoanaerobaculia bacterium]